jgi:hypothetical protein
MARYLSFYGGSARVHDRDAKQGATIVGFLIIASVMTVLAMAVESRLTPDQRVQDFEQSPTYP